MTKTGSLYFLDKETEIYEEFTAQRKLVLGNRQLVRNLNRSGLR